MWIAAHPLVASAAADGEPAGRLPLPAADVRAKALSTVREIFQPDLDKAKTGADQSALCDKLSKVATDTSDDPVARFVLYQVVVEIATKAGDVPRAFAALEAVARDFESDDLAAKSRTLASIAPQINAKNFKDSYPAGVGLATAAVAAGRFDLAKTVYGELNGLAQKYGDTALKKTLLSEQAEAERLERSYAEVAAALERLKGLPHDPAANGTVGKYELFKGNFARALPYLARSGDVAYQEVAAKELEPPKTFADQMAVADAWWKLADAEKSPQKEWLQAHAAVWYKLALPDATGLVKSKIEIRLEATDKLAVSPPARESTAANGSKTLTNKLGLKLVLIPPGEFVIGSPQGEGGRRNNETQHRVKITKSFYLGAYAVTKGQFAKFVAETKYQTDAEKDGKGSLGLDPAGKGETKPEYTWRNPGMTGNQQNDNHPVVAVSWNDAQAFCAWLSKSEGRKYRLPTEAEWEYACRAGTTTPFNFGDVLNGETANCNGDYPYGTKAKGPNVKNTMPVGSLKPNAFGLFEMHGNVKQYCADWYEKDYNLEAVDDPAGPASGTMRVMRGGSWRSSPVSCRSAFRFYSDPTDRRCDTGIRVALDP